jgi:MtN3 and saliva related transmembrane protein
VTALVSSWITLVGLVAAVCTTTSFAPQVVRVWRLKRAEEISLTTFVVFSIGTLVWLIYGILIGSLPVAIANGVTLGLTSTILWLKVKWDWTSARNVA